MKKFFIFFTLALTLSFFMTSCSDDDSDDGPTGVTMTGVVKNVTDNAVVGAAVTLTSSASTYTFITNESGIFTAADIAAGTYVCTIYSDGYTLYTNNVVVSANLSMDFQLLGSADITGTILNSQTGNGIENAEVRFYSVSAKSGDETDILTPAFIVYTDEYGFYSSEFLPTGIFSIEILAEGFYSNVIELLTLVSGENYLGEITAVEEIAVGQYRIVLSWGEYPSDLDTHVTGPTTSGERFHVYFVDKSVDNGTVLNLDVDDTYSYGPETITIHEHISGMYRYSVHNFSDQSTNGGEEIFTSPALVRVFDNTGEIAAFSPVPFVAETGNTWRVFEFAFVSDIMVISEVNGYVYALDYSNINIFKSGEKGAPKFNTTDF